MSINRSREEIERLFAAGLEVEDGSQMWAVYEMCNDDETHFVAVFKNETVAREFASTLCDADVLAAVVSGGDIVTSNTYELETHEQVEAMIERCRHDDGISGAGKRVQ